jgi:hypothetical protein
MNGIHVGNAGESRAALSLDGRMAGAVVPHGGGAVADPCPKRHSSALVDRLDSATHAIICLWELDGLVTCRSAGPDSVRMLKAESVGWWCTRDHYGW